MSLSGRPRNDRPAGYRVLGPLIRQTEKAGLFEYYGVELWIPISTVRVAYNADRSAKVYTAPEWAIESAKDNAYNREIKKIVKMDEFPDE